MCLIFQNLEWSSCKLPLYSNNKAYQWAQEFSFWKQGASQPPHKRSRPAGRKLQEDSLVCLDKLAARSWWQHVQNYTHWSCVWLGTCLCTSFSFRTGCRTACPVCPCFCWPPSCKEKHTQIEPGICGMWRRASVTPQGFVSGCVGEWQTSIFYHSWSSGEGISPAKSMALLSTRPCHQFGSCLLMMWMMSPVWNFKPASLQGMRSSVEGS